MASKRPRPSDPAIAAPAPKRADAGARAVRLVRGDLLRAPETYIVHQCNAVSTAALGLSKELFRAFPYADIYAARRRQPAGAKDARGKAGDVVVCGDGKAQRYVVNLIGQVYPGPPKYGNDTAALRVRYFREALDRLRDVVGPGSVAFPYKIGCGLGGGDWAVYEALLADFAGRIPGDVVVYQLGAAADPVRP